MKLKKRDWPTILRSKNISKEPIFLKKIPPAMLFMLSTKVRLNFLKELHSEKKNGFRFFVNTILLAKAAWLTIHRTHQRHGPCLPLLPSFYASRYCSMFLAKKQNWQQKFTNF